MKFHPVRNQKLSILPIFNFDYSPAYLALITLISVGVSYLLYSKKHPWPKWLNWTLFGLRVILLFFIMVLLLNPMMKQFQNNIERPLFVFAIDDSQSMTNGDQEQLNSVVTSIETIRQKMYARGMDISLEMLSGKESNLNQVQFQNQETNLNNWLQNLDAQYEDKNVASLILISDGIYNKGASPDYFPYKLPINVIGVGDTIQPTDIVLKNVLYNKVAYQDNKFPVIAEVANYGFKGNTTRIDIKKAGKTIKSKVIKFTKETALQRVEFEIEALKAGLMGLSIEVAPLGNEEITENNFQRLFIEIVKGKPKIVIAAPAPHPDIKALAAVIEQNQNFQLETWIPHVKEPKSKEGFDLAIIHNPYDRYNKTLKLIETLKKQKTPMLFVLGNRSYIKTINKMEPLINITQKRSQHDQVTGSVNQAFSKFEIDPNEFKIYQSFPPISVPYGEYSVPIGHEALLFQNVGSIETRRPLFFIGESNSLKSGVLYGEGIWKWRMQEFAINNDTRAFDGLFMKAIKYLSTKENRKKLRAYTTKEEFASNEAIEFKAELYNELYERIYGTEIKFTVTGPNAFEREYIFTPSSRVSKLEITDLKEGIYNYEATATVNNKKERVKGVFSVKEIRLESLNRVSNFNLLRSIAKNNQGSFYTSANINDLQHALMNKEFPNRISSNEEILSVINIKWLLALIILLATIEWLVRKYQGGY
ncbi:hypothetical protein [Reichenbachiella versicolor]|uniref:hypothetical protein n=1 Tax=Reichenbachiella versicolor TaxID=1821036 RepID=UPI001C87D17E|nr:hypothetical protein [Reichenbachiella versicolor]